MNLVAAIGGIAACSIIAAWIGGRRGPLWLLPSLQAISVYPFLLVELKGSLVQAYFLLVFWVALWTVIVIARCVKDPDSMREIIWRAEPYTSSMFTWIESGILPEGKSSSVMRAHLRQAFLYT